MPNLAIRCNSSSWHFQQKKKKKRKKGFLVQIDIYSASIAGGIFENLGVRNDIETQGFGCDSTEI